MLIWIDTAAGVMGVPEGVVRGEQMERLMSLEALRERIERDSGAAMERVRELAEAELQAAREEARRILEQAQAEAEQLRRQAYQEGTRQAVSDWHERQAAAAVDKTRVVQEMHAKLADVVTNAVERIVQTQDRASLYERALKNVQSLTRGATALKLRVGPDDYAHACQCIASIADLQDVGLSVEVVSDAGLRPGSCIFESDLGVLDASLQTQLDGLRAAMERAVRRAAAEHEAAQETSSGEQS
ncbi:MAG TPA: type III secretion system stator protein SctL [Albitalea sp.]|uniref:type III secretion system stator protein SctL n=1 Tax=Piscinibacter sp. TaxID=1903157 RepID=UPI002ED0E492